MYTAEPPGGALLERSRAPPGEATRSAAVGRAHPATSFAREYWTRQRRTRYLTRPNALGGHTLAATRARTACTSTVPK